MDGPRRAHTVGAASQRQPFASDGSRLRGSPAPRPAPAVTFLRPVVRFAARVAAGGPAATAATILHRAGALPRNRSLERASGSFVVGVRRCLC
uniref:Uncharacterized protein n=1 Tax=Setaria viridis TaxID=4556 RepID=A0A4U6VL88_SETVI|nr:hypothetical protein SEVIR_2G038200v2 [Setaria viridis]